MAKKGQAVQLQQEIFDDDDWEKLLQKDGLIVVDIFSEWCGPCTGMTGNLRKLKLEIGGDTLTLAIAKSDYVTALERFKNQSEPSWMFISGGKMVNFMYGANAPRLTKMILDELKIEQTDPTARKFREISDLADEEKIRFDAAQKIIKHEEEIEAAKKAKELLDRRTKEARSILDLHSNVGVILVFPHARDRYMEVLKDVLEEAGLIIYSTEKVDITEEILEELFYFERHIPFDDDLIDELINKRICERETLALIIKVNKKAPELTTTMDEAVLKMIYGESKCPPGDLDSPAYILSEMPQFDLKPKKPPVSTVAPVAIELDQIDDMEEEEGEEEEGGGGEREEGQVAEEEDKIEEMEEEEDQETIHLTGIWAPIKEETKATCFRLFVPLMVQQNLIPEPQPIPEHIAIIFNANKRHEVAPIMEKYREEILGYGFFTSENPKKAKLIQKNFFRYETDPDKTLDEKLVIKLSRKQSECVFTFASMDPLYLSANTDEGKKECKIFFPDSYFEKEEEEEEEEDNIENAFIIREEDIREVLRKEMAKDVEEGSIRMEAGAIEIPQEAPQVVEKPPESEIQPPEGEIPIGATEAIPGEAPEGVPGEVPAAVPEGEPVPATVGEPTAQEVLVTEGAPTESAPVIETAEAVLPATESGEQPAPEATPAPGPAEAEAEAPVLIQQENIEELLYFAKISLPDELVIEIGKKQNLAIQLKRTSEELSNVIDEVILQMVYGNERKAPGAENCPYQQIMGKTNKNEDKIGIYAPPNALAKALALKILFPHLCNSCKLPEIEEIPPHVAVVYDAFKHRDVLELSSRYPGQVMKYGFFTSEIVYSAHLIAKTVDEFENRKIPTTYEEKFVIQLIKLKNEGFMAFCELGPIYMSPNSIIGEEECRIFFPKEYDAPEKDTTSTKKKTKKKAKKSVPLNKDNQEDIAISSATDRESEIINENESAHGDEGEENILDDGQLSDDEVVEGADKATSPIEDFENDLVDDESQN